VERKQRATKISGRHLFLN